MNIETSSLGYRDFEGYQGDIDVFRDWLAEHPKLAHVPQDVMDIITLALRKGDEIHINDTRANGDMRYIHHPIATIIAILEKYPRGYSSDIIALMLHDTVDDHPECWKDIFCIFGPQIFRDVLILSKISSSTRREMLEWIFANTDHDNPIIQNILQILNPQDPLFKLGYFESYDPDIYSQEEQKMRGALLLYRNKLILTKKDIDIMENGEYISLGNYLYFEKRDARRKLQDMLHNMEDMKVMEEKKPGYIEKRRIKAYILGVKLKNFGMNDEYSELEQAFQKVGMQMISDAEVSREIDRTHSV